VFARLSIVGAALLLAACQPMPESYAPPIQRTPVEAFRPYRVSRVVMMSDGDADQRIVADIGGPSGSWRWTGQRPTVKVVVKDTANVKYVIDFAVAEATFAQTGPVSITFRVNDQVLETVRYDKPGDYHFEKPVPAEWLKANEDILVAAELDKIFIAPEDGAKLGLILTRLGLTQ
jgi:hypothetical protein